MGLYDRDYSRSGFRSQFGHSPQMRFGFPKPSPIVMRLLIINAAVFLVSIIIIPLGKFIYQWGMLDATSLPRALQIWRLITYQFLHGNFWHIFLNMLGLYMLGPKLERDWGPRRFLAFYLGCGTAGGLFYLLLVAINFLPGGQMVGASGAVLGLLAACAILYPGFMIFIFPIPLPIPIRLATIVFSAVYIFYVTTKGANAGGHAAHLGGMAAGALYVFSQPWWTKLNLKNRSGRRQKQVTTQRNLQAEVDRILKKVHDSGIRSLTSQEKRILKQATEAERMRNKL